jgi:hypothetical protein
VGTWPDKGRAACIARCLREDRRCDSPGRPGASSAEGVTRPEGSVMPLILAGVIARIRSITSSDLGDLTWE